MSKYYNAMLTGTDRSIKNCGDVYDRLKGYKIFAITDCGFGMDGTCNKRIRYDGSGGITDVRDAFASVIGTLGVTLDVTVNSKSSCEF